VVCDGKRRLTLGAMMGRDDSREAPIVLFQDLYVLNRICRIEAQKQVGQ
jgi:hypothetical protein